jgi:hypothetical protein
MTERSVTFEDLGDLGGQLMLKLDSHATRGCKLAPVGCFGLLYNPETWESFWATAKVALPSLTRGGDPRPLTDDQIYRDVIDAAEEIMDSLEPAPDAG